MAASAIRAFLTWLGAALLLACALPVAAQNSGPAAAPATHTAATCHAYSSQDTALEQAAIPRLSWTCGGNDWKDGEPATWLRFDVSHSRTAPIAFSSRITRFRSISIAALARDGTLRTRHFTPADARPILAGPVFALPLPPARADTAAYIVRIERPHSVTVASEARISADPEKAHGALTTLLVLALVAGMLLTPLLFDVNFYVVLRERFVLLHAAMVVAMIAYVLFAGGLVTVFADLPIGAIAIAGALSWALGVGVAAFFMTNFLEPHALPRPVALLTRATGWWTMLVPGFFALQLAATQPFDNSGYFLCFAPVIPIYTLAIIVALLRGSRAARFLVIAWLPIIIASTERLLRGIGVLTGSTQFDHGLFLALGLEVIIIALGVADRFLAVRRERDVALSEARSMEELSEQDPLTGLLNRRALADRFDELRRSGFQTIALLDLDRFKDINDRFGHMLGDDVLRAVGAALAADRETRAFRMGGEEFLLLLRGEDAATRAEHIRQALPTRIAGEIEGLDRMVTASMGLIDMGNAILPEANLTVLYERADKLLYEAKAGGRNRMVSERMRIFRPRRNDRRAAA